MPGPGLSINAKGLEGIMAGLKSGQQTLARERRKANRKVAEKVAGWSQAKARSGTRVQARYAGALRPASTQNLARIRVNATGRNGGANTAFFGAKRRSGWYGATKYRGSTGQQHPEWVGASWIAGQRGEGPYVVNDTIAAHQAEVDELVLDAPRRALHEAFGGST